LHQRVAIYDLGGGTFDISVIDIKGKIFEVIATGGDTFLGGVDFDDRLMQSVLQDFVDESGVDVSYDRRAVTLIRNASEDAKISLSDVMATQIQIEEICTDDDGETLTLDMEVTRDTLENLTSDLIDRSIATCERILEEAGSTREQIDEMLLVGGQSRMPLVRRKIEQFIGKPPSDKVHPDEAVAIGAAVMAHSLASTTATQDMTLLDVLPMAIGLGKPDGTMYVLFAKNQPLPDYKTRKLTTNKDQQRSIMLRIYQGESKLTEENELLGVFVFSGLRDAARGEVQVEVTFHIDSEGILNLSARDADTGDLVESRLKLESSGSEPKRKKRRRKKKKKNPPSVPEALEMPVQPSLASKVEPVTLTIPPPPEEAPKRGPASRPAMVAPVVEKQSFMSRLLSWLRGLFGGK
jgi:molecular chaperone DnaK